MLTPAVTMLYAGLCAGLLFALSVRVIRMRRQLSVSVGDAGDEEMTRRIRAQANFSEYVPIALLLILLLELAGTPAALLHLLGIVLLVGRLLHAWSLTARSGRARVAGMSMTFAVLVSAGALNVVAAFAHWLTS
jgi:uncharacterized membrane protein YecN with MAPEG domain